MLRIRLSRTGKKGQPSYRVVVSDIEAKRDGRVVERIGHFNPLANPEQVSIKEDRALYWLSVGAQPSDAVKRLLQNQGTYDRLARLHKGESFDSLVAEYEGLTLGSEVEAAEIEAEVVAVAAAAAAVVEEEE